MGNDGIDLSLKNIWRNWFEFKKGKNFGDELHDFQYYLESNLGRLFQDLNNGNYHHGGYIKFFVCDNKKREISVASVRDRLVHRVIYDYLAKIYDKTFIYDAWSCRVGKGLLAAVERTQEFLKSYPEGFIWRGDVRKFFDSVDQEVLLKMLALKIKDEKTLNLLKEVTYSFSSDQGIRRGMPIGNLTSQIFANIYLNELDRFVKHQIKPKAYLREAQEKLKSVEDLEGMLSILNVYKKYMKLGLMRKDNFHMPSFLELLSDYKKVLQLPEEDKREAEEEIDKYIARRH